MTTDNSRERSDNYRWHKYYTQEEREISYMVGTGDKASFCTATLGIPRLITKTLATKQIGELPIVTVNKTDYSEKFKDNSALINTFFGYGTIFVFPFIDGLGNLDIEIIKYDDDYNDLMYVEENGRLVMVTYNKNETLAIDKEPLVKTVYYKHYLENDAYFFLKYYKDTNDRTIYLEGHDGKQPTCKGGKMLITKQQLRLNSVEKGVPVYAEAIKLIQDADRTYTEMLNAMDLLRPIVGIPHALIGNTVRDAALEANEPIVMSEYSRLFAVIPGMKESELDWKYFGGTYDPKSYIETLNIVLDLVSKKSGLGARYLSYDNQQGGLRTAKEVVYSQNEAFINQALLNQSVEQVISDIAWGFWKLNGNLDSTEIPVIVVEMQDSVFNTTDDYYAALDLMMTDGLLDPTQYLIERLEITEEKAKTLLAESESVDTTIDNAITPEE